MAHHICTTFARISLPITGRRSHDHNHHPPDPRSLANIPCPAGAVEVSDWDNPADPTERRYFRGTQRFIDCSDDEYNGDLVVDLWGTQTMEGQVYRYVDVLDGGSEAITLSSAAHVRALGQALIAAADEIDEMTSRDPVGRRRPELTTKD